MVTLPQWAGVTVENSLPAYKRGINSETETETALFSNNLHNMIIKQDL